MGLELYVYRISGLSVNLNKCKVKVMRDTMLRQQRDFEFFEAYREALKTNVFANQREAVDYVRTHPAPRWYVSREFCAAVLSSLLRGKDHYKMGKSKRRMFDALLRLYQEKRQDPSFAKMKHAELCEHIVSLPAPEWFIGYERADDIILAQMREWNNNRTKKYENW